MLKLTKKKVKRKEKKLDTTKDKWKEWAKLLTKRNRNLTKGVDNLIIEHTHTHTHLRSTQKERKKN